MRRTDAHLMEGLLPRHTRSIACARCGDEVCLRTSRCRVAGARRRQPKVCDISSFHRAVYARGRVTALYALCLRCSGILALTLVGMQTILRLRDVGEGDSRWRAKATRSIACRAASAWLSQSCLSHYLIGGEQTRGMRARLRPPARSRSLWKRATRAVRSVRRVALLGDSWGVRLAQRAITLEIVRRALSAEDKMEKPRLDL